MVNLKSFCSALFLVRVDRRDKQRVRRGHRFKRTTDLSLYLVPEGNQRKGSESDKNKKAQLILWGDLCVRLVSLLGIVNLSLRSAVRNPGERWDPRACYSVSSAVLWLLKSWTLSNTLSFVATSTFRIIHSRINKINILLFPPGLALGLNSPVWIN